VVIDTTHLLRVSNHLLKALQLRLLKSLLQLPLLVAHCLDQVAANPLLVYSARTTALYDTPAEAVVVTQVVGQDRHTRLTSKTPTTVP
jgi:hypothetical protein